MDLYNKYRPRTFEDMYPTCKSMVQMTARAAAFLGGDVAALPQNMIFYSEAPGLGKTTSGRILANLLNPSLTDSERENLFEGRENPVFTEINGGDYRKIDDMRTLTEQIKYRANAMWGYKYVYMINEAHQLTSDAQQLMLDTTENLPRHIFIILTTTNIYSLNDKLRSRFEKHAFMSLPKDECNKMLLEIAKAEGKAVPVEKLDSIYTLEGGCPRGSIVALGKYLRTGQLDTPMDEEEAERPYFKEYIEMMERVVIGDAGTTWNKTIKPHLQVMLNDFAMEDMRIKIIQRLGSVLMDPESTKGTTAKARARLYEILSQEFSAPIGIPPKSDMIIRFFRAYRKAAAIAGESSTGK